MSDDGIAHLPEQEPLDHQMRDFGFAHVRVSESKQLLPCELRLRDMHDAVRSEVCPYPLDHRKTRGQHKEQRGVRVPVERLGAVQCPLQVLRSNHRVNRVFAWAHPHGYSVTAPHLLEPVLPLVCEVVGFVHAKLRADLWQPYGCGRLRAPITVGANREHPRSASLGLPWQRSSSPVYDTHR